MEEKDEDTGEDKIQVNIRASIQVDVELSGAKRRLAAAYGDSVFAVGLKVRREMWGKVGAEHQMEASDFLWPTQNYVTRHCFGETLTRPPLSRKVRRAGSARGDGD